MDPDFDHGFSDVVAAGDVDADLEVDGASGEALSDFLGLADSVLETVRSDADDASAVTLWPEHFDIALDLAHGDPPDAKRVNVGGSPGDSGHPTPYLYVGPWTADRPGDADYWNTGFGATLGHDEIRRAGDGSAQRDRAVEFVQTGLSFLRQS